MEPAYEHQTQQETPGQREIEPPKPVRAKDAMPRCRIGLVVLIALLTEIIVIAVADNQWVSDKISRLNPTSHIEDGLRAVGLVFAWRFTPQHGDSAHLWAGSLALIGTTIVLSLLLMVAVIRGPVTFGRAFFGTWMAVVVAVFIGAFVRGLVVDLRAPGQGSRLDQALFGVLKPDSVSFIAGLGLGLIVAIVVGIVAPATRRPPVVPLETAVPAGTAQPRGEDFFGGSQDYPPWREERFGPPAPSNVTVGGEQPTTALPGYDRPPENYPPPGQAESPTTALPMGVPAQWNDADQPTTALTPPESRERESTQPHDPFPARQAGEPGAPQAHEPLTAPATDESAQSARAYGDAPQSPYGPNTNAARSPAAEQWAAGVPPEQQLEPEPMPEPIPQPATQPEAPPMPPPEPAESPEAAAQRGAGPQGTAELPRTAEPPQGTAQFPRPPDDEDIDPEH
jgi:hypothetical protein